MFWKNKLLGVKNIRVQGAKFSIKKLEPADFLEDGNLYPFSLVENLESKAPSKIKQDFDSYKDVVKKVILKGVISPNLSSAKGVAKPLLIDEIMETEVLYNVMFSAIFLHAFNRLKKKVLSSFGSVERLPSLSTT